MSATDKVEALTAQRELLLERVQTMLNTPEDQRPKTRTALRAWLTELEGAQRLIEQVDRLLQMLDRRPKPRRGAIVGPAPAPASPEESDAVVLARIPKGSNAELRVAVKTWKGRRVFDVRCWSLLKTTGEFGPTRKGVTVDARMLPALVEALHLALQHV